MKKLFKWLAYITAGFILATALLAAVSQTQFFRDRLRNFALRELDTLLTAEVRLGELRGNLVAGFSIDSVSIKTPDGYFLRADRLDIRYDLLQAFSGKVSVNTLVLVHPEIVLFRGSDGVWNFKRMIRPTPDDTTKKPFDWPIAVDRFEIHGGSFRLVDSLALLRPGHVRDDSFYVEYHDFAVHDLDVRIMSALVAPAEKRATIEQLKFVSDGPDVQMQKFAGEFSVTSQKASVKKLVIQTSRSSLALDASMDGIDLLGGIDLPDLRTKPVALSLKTRDLDLNELRRFIRPVDMLYGKVAMDLVADGEFGNLDIQQLDLRTYASDLHFVGSVSHLDHPSKLYLDVKCRGSNIRYADVMSLLAGEDLPDLRSLGTGVVDFDYTGKPVDFKARVSVRTDAGTVVARSASLKIGGPEKLRYNGEVETHGLNLALLLHNKKYETALNGVLNIHGAGTTLDDVNATVDYRMDSSRFAGKPIGRSHFAVTSFRKTISADIDLASGSMRTHLQAELDRNNRESPVYKVDGNIASLNLADFLHDDTQKSDLTFRVNAEGSGLQLDRLSCNAVLDFSSSRYKEYQIDSSLVHLVIDQHDPLHSAINVTSGLADFSIKGQFDLKYMAGLFRYEVGSMNLAIGKRFRSLDSTLATSLDVNELAALGHQLATDHKNLNTEYSLTFKDLQPLSILTGNRTFNAVGVIDGNLSGNYDSLAGGARLRMHEFFYGNADSGMLIQDGVMTLKFSELEPVHPLASLRFRIKVDAGKMHVNRTKLDTLNFGIFYDKEYAGFAVKADYNKDLHLHTNGQIGVTDDGVQFTMSRLEASYKDFVWSADDGAVMAMNQNGIRVQNLVMRRDSQSVAVHGYLLTGKVIDATVSGHNLGLDGLKYVMAKDERRPDQRGFEGMANVDAHVGGTLDAPLYDTKLRARNVFYRGFPFGIIQGDVSYRDTLVHTTLLIDNRETSKAEKPDLTVQGTLPIDLALKNVEHRLVDKPMDFTIFSDGLQMSLLDPLVPTFNELSGILKTNMKVGGSPKHPVYAGTIHVENCAFLFVPNNMHYEKMNAQLEAEGERIKVDRCTVGNIPEDAIAGRQGELTITGDFLLRDLVPSDFNFVLNGNLVVVNKDTRSSSLSVSGKLPVEIQPPGLRYTGTIEHSLLSGPVLVRNASLVFPPTTATVRNQEEISLPVSIVNDTASVVADSNKPVMSRYFTSAGNELADDNTGPKDEAHLPSFIDGLRYDLDVESAGGNTEIRMVFNAATGEELLAVIDGKFTITEDGKTWVGDLDVSRASYNFYGKRFAAEGTISYSGDFLNPELNITARYEGTRSLDPNKPPEHVVVILKISGTRLAPKADMSMKIDDVDYASYGGVKSGDVQSDALTFVITGTFPLTRSDANDLAGGLSSTVQSTVVGGATSLLTSTFSEFLRTKTGFINSIELGYETGSTTSDKTFGQRADIRLSGTAFKGYWRYGGKILEDPFSNANFSLLYSFGDIFDQPLLRNFMFEYERKIITTTYYQIEMRKDVNSARFFYRFSF